MKATVWRSFLHAPRTLFVRIFLLMVGVLIVTIGTWVVIFRTAEQEPRAIQAARLVASAANLTWAAVIHADPEQRLNLLAEFSATEGIRLLPADGDEIITPLPDDTFHRIFAAEARRLLGGRTRLAQAVSGEQGLWASFWIEDEDEYWIVVPPERLAGGVGWQWFGWGLLAAALVLVAAWRITRRITVPLRGLGQAAREIGQGRRPSPLPRAGTEEVAEVAVAFNRMVSDLSRMEQDRTLVLAGISHDLRTPIARLRLEVEMGVPDASIRDAMVADLEQMDAIIGQFLTYARGEEPEALSREDVCSLLQAAAERIQLAGADIECQCRGPLWVMARPTSLRRAIDNLLENARKYGGPKITIEAQATAGHEVVLRVSDRGPGIPAADRARMLQPFTRLEGARSNANGTGLGLAIVDRIVRHHGGTLALLEREGGGLTVEIRLPMIG